MIIYTPDNLSSLFKEVIQQYRPEIFKEIKNQVNFGTVFYVKDDIVTYGSIYGLEKVIFGELLEFEDGTLGIALNLETNNVGAVLLDCSFLSSFLEQEQNKNDNLLLKITEGSRVRCTAKIVFSRNVNEDSLSSIDKIQHRSPGFL